MQLFTTKPTLPGKKTDIADLPRRSWFLRSLPVIRSFSEEGSEAE